MDPHVSLVLLGGFEARRGSDAPLSLSNKAQALLACLAVRPGRRQSRDKLAALLWPSAGDEHARQSLRQVLAALRRVLGPPAILADHQEVALDDPRLDVDVVRFERLVAEGSPAALREAVELYQGDLLEGIRINEPPFDEWLLGERERLRELAQDALRRLLAHQQRAGLTEAAIRTAMRILTLDPANETAHRDLMRLFERQGRRGDALRQYRLCVDALQREAGVEPQLATRRLYQELVRGEPVAPRAADRQPGARRERAAPPPEGPRDLSRHSPPLIGRDAELTRLRDALDAAERGRGRLVVVLGEAGIGKSSLLEALESDASRRGVRGHLGRSYLSESVLAFAPWIDALRAEADADPALLAHLGPAWVDELARLFPDLAVGALSRPRNAAEPQRLFEAISRLVSGLAADCPRLIMLEDVHWADEMSLRLLAFVARRVPATRALVVATAREEELPGASILAGVLEELALDPRVDRIALSPLSRAQTAALVRSLARSRSAADAVADLSERVFETSGGNPFVVVETMRALADGAIAEASVGAAVPDRVRQLITGRLERLGERSRGLLATAAVIGREFDFALLPGAAGLADADAAEDIEALVRRRFLRVVGERFDFVHDQVREVVYGQLLPPRRTLLHAAVVQAIERLHAGRLDEHVEQLAHHALRGEVWDKAVLHGRRAGDVAAERSASAQAAAYFAQAIQALARRPDDPEALEQGIELRELLTAHLFALGQRAAYLESMTEAVALAERLGDPRWLARVLSLRSNALWFAGDSRRALESADSAIALAEPIGAADPLIQATLNLGMICNTLGDYHRAAAALARAVELMRGERESDRLGRTLYPAVTARGELARAQAELGQFDTAAATVEEAIALATALRHSTTLLVARLDGCHVQLCRGSFRDATAELEACIREGRAAGQVVWATAAAGMLGHALAMVGRHAEAIPLLREAVEHAAQGRRTREALFTTYLAEALCLAGQAEEAAALAERALALSRERCERGTEARALYVLGGIATGTGPGDPSPAARRYDDALSLAVELGMRPLAALCHLGLGRAGRTRGQGATERQHLATATAMLRELRMPFWLELAAGDGAAR